MKRNKEFYEDWCKAHASGRRNPVYAGRWISEYLFYQNGSGTHVLYRGKRERSNLPDHWRGQLVGEAAFLSHLRQSTISAVKDTELLICPVGALYPFIESNKAWNQAIFELLVENYTELCSQMRRLTISSSVKRIASFLADLTEHDNPEVGIVNHTLPYTQEELAVCLNLHRTTAARVLSQFAKQNIVRLGYKKIQVLDIPALKEIAAS